MHSLFDLPETNPLYEPTNQALNAEHFKKNADWQHKIAAWRQQHPEPTRPLASEIPLHSPSQALLIPFSPEIMLWWGVFLVCMSLGSISMGASGVGWAAMRQRGELEPFSMATRPP